ncbi:hypothetical protein FQA47_007309 [Oryzias melastigma]|uniref:Uncharacterized protein n=1 Tax=Oryzias melastigma TaxID=30732 RepID=A0A834EZY9_ORYME|nr:hypothetical protein FQA47_007309 [Oryzias melastigma]
MIPLNGENNERGIDEVWAPRHAAQRRSASAEKRKREPAFQPLPMLISRYALARAHARRATPSPAAGYYVNKPDTTPPSLPPVAAAPSPLIQQLSTGPVHTGSHNKRGVLKAEPPLTLSSSSHFSNLPRIHIQLLNKNYLKLLL